MLGIGLSHKIVIEDMYGYKLRRPASTSAKPSILLPLLDGEAAAFKGKTISACIGLSTRRRPGTGHARGDLPGDAETGRPVYRRQIFLPDDRPGNGA